jgi:hypothetical protein
MGLSTSDNAPERRFAPGANVPDDEQIALQNAPRPLPTGVFRLVRLLGNREIEVRGVLQR